MGVYESTKDLAVRCWTANNDLKNWKCCRCDVKFTYYNEWIFHRKVSCPNMTSCEKEYVAPNGSYENTKKNRQCYRCGRYGHYYYEGECYAVKDNNGVDITWGKPKIPCRIKSPPAKTWETSPGWMKPHFDGTQVHTPLIHTKKGIVHKEMPC